MPIAATARATALGKSRPLKRNSAARIFGYDLFISFALGPPPRGTQSYASDLARRLRERDLTVFFSEDEASPGERLDSTLLKALLRSRVLVVIANRGTLEEPRWVRTEVEEFSKCHPDRPIIPINVDRALQDATAAEQTRQWLAYDDKIWLDESQEAVAQGIASEELITRLAMAPAGRSSNAKWRWVVRAVLAVLIVLTSAATAFGLYARKESQEAKRQQGIADERRRQADAAREAERLQKIEAERQRNSAEEQRARAERERTAAEAKSLGLAALRDFESGRQIQALIEAVQGGRKLESLSGDKAAFAQYPTADPILALTRVLDRIRERNRLEHHEDSRRLQGKEGVINSGKCPLLEGNASELQRRMGQSGRPLAGGCTPDGRYLVTTATDGTVRMLDTTGSGQPELIGLQGAATRLSFEPDSLHFRTTDVWATTVDWDLSGANHGQSRAVLRGHKAVVTSISFGSGGGLLATGSRDGEIRLWTDTGHELGPPISTGAASVVALQLSPDGKRIASLAADGLIQQWDRSGRPAIPSFNTGDLNIIHAVFRPDGLFAAAAIAGGSVHVYGLAARTSAPVRGQHTGWIMGVAFNPAGDIVATAGADGTVGISYLSGQPFAQPIRAGQGQVMSVAFSPDNKLLATGGDDGTVKLWTLSGAEIGKLVGHQGKVLNVSFGSDGQLIETASSDGTVRLWLPSGEQVNQYEGRHGFLAEEALGGSFGAAGVSLSPDGQNIAIADSEGGIDIWRIQKLGELLARACAWLGPYLASHPSAPRVCSGS